MNENFNATTLINYNLNSFEQFANAAEETTTQNLLDSIKTGIDNTFSEQNVKKAVDGLNEIGDKLKNLGTRVLSNIQNAMKTDETTAAPTA